MLTVYTYRIPKPAPCYDLSSLSITDMVDAVVSLCQHQTSGTVWLGYLDGWMLTPQEEVQLRAALRIFSCVLVSRFPLALSRSWKNEIDTIYTTNPNISVDNGPPHSDHDGRSV